MTKKIVIDKPKKKVVPRPRPRTKDPDAGLAGALTVAFVSVLGNLAQAATTNDLESKIVELTALLRQFRKAYAVREQRLVIASEQIRTLQQELEHVRAEAEGWRKDSATWQTEIASVHVSMDRERRSAEQLTMRNAQLVARLAEHERKGT